LLRIATIAVVDNLAGVATRTHSTTTGTRWLDADEMRAWRAYIETVFQLNAALEADLAEHDLTLGDYQVLVFLSEAEGSAMRMCDLAVRLQLSPSGLTRRLDGLVRTGLVERRPSETDRRVMLAVLTRKGSAALEKAAPTHVDSVRARIFDQIDRRDIPALERIFTAVHDGLRVDEAP
jgi:DNA-binding MarR family transcriptional regulator